MVEPWHHQSKEPSQISIVMPTYNGMSYLSAAVDSVLQQETQKWQLLISDDGSTDGTREYLASLVDPRIHVFFQDKNLGIFGNLNFLIAKVQSLYTYILCQDDYFVSPQVLSLVASEWAKCQQDIAFIRFNHSSDSTSALERFEKQVLPSLVKPEISDLYFFVFGCVPGNLSNVCMKTDIVAKYGWFDQTLPYAGDFEFWARVGRQRSWRISTTKVVEVRRHEGQASMNLNKKGELLQQLNRILETLFQNLSNKGYSPFRLKVFATLCYLSMHRYIGIRFLMKGGSVQYLVLVRQSLGDSIYALPSAAAWFVFFVSGGGKIFRVFAAKMILGTQAGREPN